MLKVTFSLNLKLTTLKWQMYNCFFTFFLSVCFPLRRATYWFAHQTRGAWLLKKWRMPKDGRWTPSCIHCERVEPFHFRPSSLAISYSLFLSLSLSLSLSPRVGFCFCVKIRQPRVQFVCVHQRSSKFGSVLVADRLLLFLSLSLSL